jgi:hypothetical protein
VNYTDELKNDPLMKAILEADVKIGPVEIIPCSDSAEDAECAKAATKVLNILLKDRNLPDGVTPIA